MSTPEDPSNGFNQDEKITVKVSLSTTNIRGQLKIQKKLKPYPAGVRIILLLLICFPVGRLSFNDQPDRAYVAWTAVSYSAWYRKNTYSSWSANDTYASWSADDSFSPYNFSPYNFSP